MAYRDIGAYKGENVACRHRLVIRTDSLSIGVNFDRSGGGSRREMSFISSGLFAGKEHCIYVFVEEKTQAGIQMT